MAKTSLRCRFCRKVEPTKTELIRHERVHTHTGEKPFTCKHCLAEFTWKATLQLHEVKCGQLSQPLTKSQSSITTESQQSRRIGCLSPSHVTRLTLNGKTCYSCNFCKKICKGSTHCERHIRSHTGEKPFKCSYCPKAFSLKYGLQIHENIHTRSNLYQCKHCLTFFTAKSALSRHESMCNKSHSSFEGSNNNNNGNVSQKNVTSKPTSKQNTPRYTPMATSPPPPPLSLNSGVKSRRIQITNPNATRLLVNGKIAYSCNFCKKHFKDNNACLRHTRIHTGEKPFNCSYCPKSFSLKGNATIHERVHTGEKPYACLIQSCGRRFKSSAELNLHLKCKKHV